MAIVDEILKGPVNVAELQKANASLESQLNGAFTNFLAYARKNWTYTASGNTGGEHLLNGSATSAPCGGIATALKLLFKQHLNVPEDRIQYIRVTGYVWTGPTYLCFDPQVKGNLRSLDNRTYNNGCIFNEHYYLYCEGKYYDPCLSTAYDARDQSVKEKFAGKQILSVEATRKLLVTSDQRKCILYMPSESVPGFRGAWCMFDASKKNMEKALGAATFKKEMAARHGQTEFAKFVNTLKN